MANNILKTRILDFISEYTAQNGYAPTYREIQQSAGVKSVSTVHYYVKLLESDGRLSPRPGHGRTLNMACGMAIGQNTTQRVRVDVADGGHLYLDCSCEPTGAGGFSLVFSGVVDITQMKKPVGSVVGFTFDNE